MRSLFWVLAASLLSPVAVFVHASKVVTVRVPTGTCYPDGGTGGSGSGSNGNSSGSGGIGGGR